MGWRTGKFVPIQNLGHTARASVRFEKQYSVDRKGIKYLAVLEAPKNAPRAATTAPRTSEERIVSGALFTI